MNYDSLLKVTSNEPDDGPTHVFAYDSQRFVLRPGKSSMVTFDALIRSMGDPRSGPQPQQIHPEGGNAINIPSRRDELKRLSVMYGTYSDAIDTPSHIGVSGVDGPGPTLIERIPKISATNLDEDDLIIFPSDDPECTSYTPEDTDKSSMAVMQRQLEALRRKSSVMEQLLKQATGNSASEILEESGEVTEDTPQSSRRIAKSG